MLYVFLFIMYYNVYYFLYNYEFIYMVDSIESAKHKIEQYVEFKEKQLEMNPNMSNRQVFNRYYYTFLIYAKRAYLVYFPIAVFFR
jgi:hypothetical protein